MTLDFYNAWTLIRRNTMKKYEIVKEGLDNYILKYKDKEIRFKSTVNIVNKLQETTKKARMQLVMDLAKEGKTIKDLIVETEKDGKIIQDHSNKDFVEEGYIQQAQTETFLEVIKEMLGVPLEDIVLDIGLTEKEVEEFGVELGGCIVGTPRQ